MTSTKDRLVQILARQSKRTPGKWVSGWDAQPRTEDTHTPLISSQDGTPVVAEMWWDGPWGACTKEDADFIAASAEDIEWLLSEVQHLQALVQEAGSCLDWATRKTDLDRPNTKREVEWFERIRNTLGTIFPLEEGVDMEEVEHDESTPESDKAGSLDTLKKWFDEASGVEGEYTKFERVKVKLSHRPDLHAFLLLEQLCPVVEGSNQPIIACSEHDEISINVNEYDLAAVATREIVRDLVRCGIQLSFNGLSRFT